MSVPAWLYADPLAAILIRRGYNSDEAYLICERVSQITADGAGEITAIESVLGFAPHSERDRLESLAEKAAPDV